MGKGVKAFYSHISVVVWSFFEFGTVSKWCIREWVKHIVMPIIYIVFCITKTVFIQIRQKGSGHKFSQLSFSHSLLFKVHRIKSSIIPSGSLVRSTAQTISLRGLMIVTARGFTPLSKLIYFRRWL